MAPTLDQEIQDDPVAVAKQANGTWEEQMSEVVQVDQVVVSVKEGAKDGKAWKKWGVKVDENRWAGTFNEAFGQKLEAAEGGTVKLDIAQNGDFWNIVNVLDAPASGTQSATNGKPDWDDIGFRKTLSQQFAAILSSDAAVTALLAGDEAARAKAMAAIDSAATHAAVKVVTYEKPKTDDVPF